MAKDDPPEPKRRNRTMSVADVLGGALDPVLKKRGFASRDIITHWAAMAPPPYDTGRELFALFRHHSDLAESGASPILAAMEAEL